MPFVLFVHAMVAVRKQGKRVLTGPNLQSQQAGHPVGRCADAWDHPIPFLSQLQGRG